LKSPVEETQGDEDSQCNLRIALNHIRYLPPTVRLHLSGAAAIGSLVSRTITGTQAGGEARSQRPHRGLET
jgi:hypothetical protein